jgi:hypothetical protein
MEESKDTFPNDMRKMAPEESSTDIESGAQKLG